MAPANLYAGWLAIFAGLVAGTVLGLFFHRDRWLGGYESWRRRMFRLGHVALVGTGLLNIAFALSLEAVHPTATLPLASALLLAGAATMPTVCFLAGWRRACRHLFFIPVSCLLAAAGDFIYHGLLP